MIESPEARRALQSLAARLGLDPTSLLPEHEPTIDDCEAAIWRFVQAQEQAARTRADAEVGRLRAERQSADDARDKMREQWGEANERLEAAEAEFAEVKRQNEKLRHEVDVAKQAVDGWKQLADSLRSGNEENRATAARLQLEVDDLKATVEARDWQLAVSDAQTKVSNGEVCAEARAAGRGRCGCCSWCVKFERDRAEAAEVRADKAEATAVALHAVARQAHDIAEALGSIRSRLPAQRRDFGKYVKNVLIESMIGLRQIADMAMDLKPNEQTGAAKIYPMINAALAPDAGNKVLKRLQAAEAEVSSLKRRNGELQVVSYQYAQARVNEDRAKADAAALRDALEKALSACFQCRGKGFSERWTCLCDSFGDEHPGKPHPVKRVECTACAPLLAAFSGETGKNWAKERDALRGVVETINIPALRDAVRTLDDAEFSRATEAINRIADAITKHKAVVQR